MWLAGGKAGGSITGTSLHDRYQNSSGISNSNRSNSHSHHGQRRQTTGRSTGSVETGAAAAIGAASYASESTDAGASWRRNPQKVRTGLPSTR